jgi:hypothetical protein
VIRQGGIGLIRAARRATSHFVAVVAPRTMMSALAYTGGSIGLI